MIPCCLRKEHTINMTALMKLILSLSLSGSLLILLLLLFRPLYRNRLSKSWQYYIWIVVILRLLLPVTPETSLAGSLFSLEEMRGTDSTAAPESPNDQSMTAYNTIKHEAGSSDDLIRDATTAENSPSASAVSPDKEAYNEDHSQIFFFLWLTGALLLFVRKLTVYQSFVKYVDAGSRPLEDIGLLESFGHIMEQNRIKGAVDLYVNSLVSSPLLIGFLRPRIILPHTSLSESDFYYTALHELTHYRRRDMFYKWLSQLTVCLHWFNPCVYLMSREINRLCELSCDERVIATLSDNARKSYGTTLVNAVGAGGSYKDTLASVTLHESKELLKGRLNAIMQYKKCSKPIKFITLLVTGILLGAATVLGAYAAPDSHTAADAADAPLSAAPSRSDYRIECEDTIYYIYVDGAGEADKPLSNITNGFYKLVFVYKDRYSTFGSFRRKDMPNLVRNLESQCRTLLENGRISQEDVELYLLVAGDIQDAWSSSDGQSYSASADGFDHPDDNDDHNYNDDDFDYDYACDFDDDYVYDSDDDLDDNDLDFDNHLDDNLDFDDDLDFDLDDNDPDDDLDFDDNRKDFDEYYLSDYLENRGLLEEYNENGIVTVKNDYYYQNTRIRILMDLRPDGSFENFDYNDRGTVDLRLVRDGSNKIIRIEYLPAEEAAGIIGDLYDTLSDTAEENITPRRSDVSTPAPSMNTEPAVVDLNRLTRAEVSDKVRKALDTCEDGRWYVIESDGCQYIYYNGLSHTYAYEPRITGSEKGDLITVSIVDIKSNSPLLARMKSANRYVLLAFCYTPADADAEYELTIEYNQTPVTYTEGHT